MDIIDQIKAFQYSRSEYYYMNMKKYRQYRISKVD